MNSEPISIKAWTKEEDEQLRELYPLSSNEDLERTFKRSIEAIRGRAHRMKIKRSGILIQKTLKARAISRWANSRTHKKQ